jgi:hypothetical protein
MTDDTDGSICTECPMTEACQEKNKVDDVTYVYDDVTYEYTECLMTEACQEKNKVECVVYRVCFLQNVFSVECVLYRMCSL